MSGKQEVAEVNKRRYFGLLNIAAAGIGILVALQVELDTLSGFFHWETGLYLLLKGIVLVGIIAFIVFMGKRGLNQSKWFCVAGLLWVVYWAAFQYSMSLVNSHVLPSVGSSWRPEIAILTVVEMQVFFFTVFITLVVSCLVKNDKVVGIRKTLLIMGSLTIVVVVVWIAWQNRPGETVLKIATKGEENRIEYGELLRDGRVKQTGKFTPDEAEFLYAEEEDFSWKLKNGGEYAVVLNSVKLINAEGKAVEADKTTKEMLQILSEEAKHEIFDVTVIVDQGEYFLFLKENVNLWTPCILYRYEEGAGELTRLHTWDSVELKGIAL